MDKKKGADSYGKIKQGGGAMKIGLLHYAAPPVVGGVENVIGHHARWMTKAGHQVRVLAGRGQPSDPQVDFVLMPKADSLHPEVLKIKKELDRGHIAPGFDELTAELLDLLNQVTLDLDVLIAHNVGSLNKNLALTAALKILSASSGAPAVALWHHDLAWTTPRYQSELHPGYPWDILRSAWPGVHQIVVSELRRQELSELMGLPFDSIQVIPNGIDLERFLKLEPQTSQWVEELDLLSADPLLLLPVRITRRKNIELALTTLAQLRKWMGGARLVVTGPLGQHNLANVEYLAELRRLRSRLGLDQAAHFLAELSQKFIPDPVIADFYRLADALFFPSREEGFGLPILEAGLSGVPIFCADILPLRELGGAQAYYFSPEAEPYVVAQAIHQTMMADPRQQMKVRIRQEYTWEGVYREHVAPFLEKLR